MDATQALILGAMQGVFEWLPVSSEGALTFVMLNFFRIHPGDALSYAIFLHLGTMLASLLKFRAEFASMMRSIISTKRSINRYDDVDDALLRAVLIATAATCLTGVPLLLMLHDIFERMGSGGNAMITFLIGALLIFTGFFIGLPYDRQYSLREIRKTTEERTTHETRTALRSISDMSTLELFTLGIVQGFAVLPGVSRSGTTVSYLLLRGINQEHTLRLSFIMSVPAILGAIAIESMHNFLFNAYIAMIMLISSLITGYMMMDVLLNIASSFKFSKFCFLIGVIAIVFAALMLI